MGYNPAYKLLQKHLSERGEKIALLCEDCSVSYAELYARVTKYAGMLLADGRVSGERVLIALPDCTEFIYAFLGSILAGLVPVPCSNLLDREQLEFLLRDCHAAAIYGVSASCAANVRSPYLQQTLLIDTPHFLHAYDAVPADLALHTVSVESPGFMLYTSGSTGVPKGIFHSSEKLLLESDHFGRDFLRMTPDDVLFSVSKMHFGFGLLNSIVHGLGAGATVVLMPDKPTLPTVRRIIASSRPTLFFAVPAIYTLLLDTAESLFCERPPRLCISSGEALPGELFSAWLERTGVEIIDSVGATETFHAFIANRPGNVAPDAAGIVIPPWVARITDETGNDVPDGIIGHLEVRLSTVAMHSGSEGMANTDNWIRTGDMFLANNGVFTFVGRADDMFKCDGNWVSPLPIENALRLHPSVGECAVRARRILGVYRPEAHIVLKQGIGESTELERKLFTFLQPRLPSHMRPVQFTFHGELPKTLTGKIRRGLL